MILKCCSPDQQFQPHLLETLKCRVPGPLTGWEAQTSVCASFWLLEQPGIPRRMLAGRRVSVEEHYRCREIVSPATHKKSVNAGSFRTLRKRFPISPLVAGQ